MIEPQGPLPPEIYWRRRVVAAGGGLVVLAVVVGLIVWMTSGNDAAKNTAANAPLSSAAATTPPVVPSEPSSQNPGGPGGPAPNGGNPAGTTTTPPTPGSSTAAVPTTGPAGPAPVGGLCPDESISVVLLMDKPTYTVGQRPVFTLVTTNAGVAACTRDVGKASQNVVVRTLDGTRTLWTARDCSPLQTVNNQLLQPGQQVRDTIVWSGTTSNPGCDKPRVQIPVGAYKAVGKIGERESFPQTFNVVAPAQQP
ncbi:MULTISPECIES: hypothetical protein [unclassified Gordonia (in: high G+C Gram-positive bacteria)]|uniref:hypothetical protein n=1 Tax=unclassified Gordonia (in: high G+C Gram-positive bacteria) TaxID=2657482 RepID=UPI001F0F463F|nr:hypothetical protein [Gordonia sp. ABSL49_1]MCH5645272.1 hypothetical protein [Gordonia sp. ABSL49_1]